MSCARGLGIFHSQTSTVSPWKAFLQTQLRNYGHGCPVLLIHFSPVKANEDAYTRVGLKLGYISIPQEVTEQFSFPSGEGRLVLLRGRSPGHSTVYRCLSRVTCNSLFASIPHFPFLRPTCDSKILGSRIYTLFSSRHPDRRACHALGSFLRAFGAGGGGRHGIIAGLTLSWCRVCGQACGELWMPTF